MKSKKSVKEHTTEDRPGDRHPAVANKQEVSSNAPNVERSYGRDADSEGFAEQRKNQSKRIQKKKR